MELLKRSRIFMVAVMLILSISVLLSEAVGKEKGNRVALTILSGNVGSDGYNFCSALGDIIKKNNPLLTTSIVETMGNANQIKGVADAPPDARKLYIGTSVDPVLNLALRGVGPFKKTGPINNWRVLFTMYNVNPHFMTLNPKIRTSKDLIGKKIGLLPKKHGMAKELLWVLDKCYGIKDKVKVRHMPRGMQKDALLDGNVDVIGAGGMFFSYEEGFKVSPFNEVIMAAKKNVYFIGVTKEEFENAKRKDPHTTSSRGPVKANAVRPGYPDRESGVMITSHTMFASKEMDDEVAYQFVKTAAENAHKVKDYFADGKAFRLETFIINTWGAKRYHPGALRFLKEKGLTPQGNL
ncbi:TAXI family TRAP transporter solute-binding subunit [Thermodesulfobacteriota bacterium]